MYRASMPRRGAHRERAIFEGKVGSMQKYDLCINEKKPGIGLYVRNGSGLPDFADPGEWIFGGTAEQSLLPSSIIASVEANGHAFRNMD
jgi:hypothetical protein